MTEPQMHEFTTTEGYWNALAVYRSDEIERLRNVQQSNEALLLDNLELRNEATRLRAERDALKVALVRLANAADTVGVSHFDSDCLDDDVQELQTATLNARSIIDAAMEKG